MDDRTLERLREIKSSLTSTEHALNPLENRFPDEGRIIFYLQLTKRECELRIEEVKEEVNESK